MENTTRTFQVSSEIFWGYRVTIDLSTVTTINDIIQFVCDDLEQYLRGANLQMLIEKLHASHFHIHSPFTSFDEILIKADPNTVIFICDHCTNDY